MTNVYDEFDDGYGRFTGYDCYDLDQRTQLRKQMHTDIRCFMNDLSDTVRISIPMLYLDLLTMADLNNKTMDDLSGTVMVRAGEQWTNGTVGKQADRNNWHGIAMDCSVGTNTTASIIHVSTD